MPRQNAQHVASWTPTERTYPLSEFDTKDQVTVLDRPGRSPYERIIEVVLLRLLDEHLPGFPLERRDAPILDGLGSSPEPTEELFDV